jgi:CheY-like chemotaxis protein
MTVAHHSHPCDLVLVVDDDRDVREAIAEMLSRKGYWVVAVANGEQALGALAVARPVLVVTDLAMPVRDGHSLIAAMRADVKMQHLPVCVVSADAECAPAGTASVTKPFDLQTLGRALRDALTTRRRHE